MIFISPRPHALLSRLEESKGRPVPGRRLRRAGRATFFPRQRRDGTLTSDPTSANNKWRKRWPRSNGASCTIAPATPAGRPVCARFSSTAISASGKGPEANYVAHLIRHNGRKTRDAVQQWHVHDCTFQLVYVLNGWAIFEYDGQGERTIRKGDCILQTPGIKHREIACSDDFEVLEIVSPANFDTRIVEEPSAQAAE